MERYQNVIVVTVIAVFILLIGGALVYSQRGANVPAQRFRAAPGAERANAQPIYSQRTDRDEVRHGTVEAPPQTDQTESAIRNAGDEGDTAAEPVWILVPDVESESEAEAIDQDAPQPVATASVDPVHHLLQTAGLAASPVESLDMLAAGAASLEAAAGLYTAAARLFMQLEPPDTEAAFAALQTASQVAATADERGEVALTQAQLLLDSGDAERAMAYLESALMASEAPSSASVRARLMLGAIYEDFDRVDDARAVYEAAESEGAGLIESGAVGAGDVYRQVAMRLSRHHRSRGEAAAADDVVKRMNALLATPVADTAANPEGL